MSNTLTDVTVVVVNWNTVGLLDDCLRSIHGSSGGYRIEVVLVDNASTDGSVEHVRSHWPSVRVIANEENVGFCRANNQAIRATKAPYVLLINTDARLEPDTIDALIGYCDRDPRAAVIAPRLVYGDGCFQRWTAGRFPSLRSCGMYLSAADRYFGGRAARASLYLGRDVRRPFQPDWVSSAVMLVRREAFDKVGLLNEALFVYMDDVDFCRRARSVGWNVWYAADTTAIHWMGASSLRATGHPSPEALRALNRWYERRYGAHATLVLRLMEALGFGSRALLCAVRSLLTRDASLHSRASVHWTHMKLSLEATDA